MYISSCQPISACSPILVLADDLPGDGDVEGPDFLAGRDDLVGGKEEAEHAGVPQLHADAKRKKNVDEGTNVFLIGRLMSA